MLQTIGTLSVILFRSTRSVKSFEDPVLDMHVGQKMHMDIHKWNWIVVDE